MTRWTPEKLAAYRALHGITPALGQAKKATPGKYRSAKVEQNGITFDSAKEARRWAELEQLQRAGQINELKRQVAFVLAPAILLAGEARKKPALRYFADATYMLDGQLVVEDTKSVPTRKKEAYRIKKHLMATVHQIHIREV